MSASQTISNYKLLWPLIALALSAPAASDVQITPYTALYKVKISIFGGILSTELRASENGYVATHEINTTGMARMISRGSVRESSEFSIQANGIKPTNYRAADSLTRDKINAEISFDWDAGEASGTVNGAEYASALDGPSFDRVAIQYELMHDLLNGGLGTQYTMFEVDELREVTVTNIGSKIVSTPAGKFEAVGIQHQSANSKRVTTMWCVKKFDYAPVVIEQYKKGKIQVRAALKSYTPHPN